MTDWGLNQMQRPEDAENFLSPPKGLSLNDNELEITHITDWNEDIVIVIAIELKIED
jgi:hypothetical protein